MKNSFIYSIIDFIFSNSYIFDKFRNIIHSNFKDEKRIISEYFKKNKKTLDFGCGAGQFSGLFNSDNYYGVDTNTKYIKFCKKKYKGKFLLIKTSPPYKFKGNLFNQIFISAVIHHIDDNNLSLIAKELKRILSKNGRLMIIDHFSKDKQDRLLCKILISLDRGKYFRNPHDVVMLFSKYFRLNRIRLFKNGPYNDYALVFKKS